VERNHFASGTSGKNSQLIHGGLRYLKNLEFGLVREALRERATLLELAPHLVEPLPFLIPMYSHFSRLFYGTGLWLYDMLAGARNIGRHRRLPLPEVKTLEPGLESDGLVGGAVFFDCRVHSARFVLENIFDAQRNGAVIANYVKSSDRKFEDGAWTVDLEDSLTEERFRVRAQKIVDTTGPWGDGSALRLVRGSHLVLPRLNASDFAIAHFEPSGRIIFLIPWGGSRNLTLVGTTDVDHQSGPDQVHISREEVRYLLDIVTALYPAARSVEPISSYSSLRPLLREEAATATSTSREHRIWNTPDGVLHISGGKYTTYRLMSEEAADSITGEIAPELRAVHLTAQTPLGENTRPKLDELRARAAAISRESGMPPEDVIATLRDYGVAMPALVRRAASLSSDLPKIQAARIAHAVECEMACRLYDLMFVSTYWGYEERWTAASLEPFAREMGRYHGWSGTRVHSEVQFVMQALASPVTVEASQ
jgi:glycerol-3-phosphate dehydrogenase